MYPERTGNGPAVRAVEVHQPTPITPAVPYPAPPVPVQPHAVPAVASVVLPDGRVVTGYAIPAAQPEPVAAKLAVSRTAVNVALGGVGFLAVCGGLLMLTAFVTALAALAAQLITLAAVIFGGWIAVQMLGSNRHGAATTVNIRKAVIKRNKFYG
ncbi:MULTISPECIES: hypothetical protein [Streptomyces]|uniref:Integral membrane protein n=1 Tax=Streptomyces doudnae TaxID=3075536 RepID=A0ABD5EKN2_9ACTN|nr:MULTISPECIES: hypothetical protein [unclassified Streptomyces]MDT0435193.1 hypothetical protein [Streptomyces sp. DSM 41981]MYQ65416.1 hypothetical protein [Streptomyces sp. SID4950]SCD99151.1 hypothetical protein GA0115242_118892 [Streptomyces sp. SolWspMP-5a-2]